MRISKNANLAEILWATFAGKRLYIYTDYTKVFDVIGHCLHVMPFGFYLALFAAVIKLKCDCLLQ